MENIVGRKGGKDGERMSEMDREREAQKSKMILGHKNF